MVSMSLMSESGDPVSEVEYRESEGPLSDEVLLAVGEAGQQIFQQAGQPPVSASAIAEQLRLSVNGHRWIHLCMAYLDGELVGYKVGRSNDPRTFESWNGGVLPRTRHKGVASALAESQEAWCRSQGFGTLTTETAHDNQAMLIVNLKRGFNIIGTYLDRGTNLKVVLQKPLASSASRVR
jgi:ribosomal protein S18 acetylase RimI-like enzyme